MTETVVEALTIFLGYAKCKNPVIIVKMINFKNFNKIFCLTCVSRVCFVRVSDLFIIGYKDMTVMPREIEIVLNGVETSSVTRGEYTTV